jgi:uncharacterized protein involved in exopolysaccharide biosynthesis
MSSVSALVSPPRQSVVANIILASLRFRRLLLIVVAAGALGGGLYRLALPPLYLSESSFTLQSTGTNPALGGLIAQLGGAGGQNMGAFYADLTTSPELARAILRDDHFAQSQMDSAGRAQLLRTLGVADARDRAQLERGVRGIRGATTADLDLRTGVVVVRTRLPNSEAAEFLNVTLLKLINAFNFDRRQERAGAELRFIERRMGEVKTNLQVAEDSLERFLIQNRSLGNDPGLYFERDKLQRELGLQQQTLNALVQASEAAKIDQIRDTPVITVVETPWVSPNAVRSSVLVDTLTGGVFGLLAGMLIIAGRVLGREVWESQPLMQQGAIAQEWHSMTSAVRRWLRLGSSTRKSDRDRAP